jgi:ubiquinone/menaquinone biosynthesis C-methylase UbiE
MTLYNTIGTTYNKTRAADERIIEALVNLLNLPKDAVIADIGAGSGNYTYAISGRGYKVNAIEPSEAMRRQAVPSPRIEWFPGVAEQIPLADASVDGVIATMAIHHFSDPGKAFTEMVRIAPNGPIVLFTFDPRVVEKTWWIADYFPTIWNDAFRAFPPISELAGMLEEAAGRTVDVVPFHLPHNLTDNFTAAGWRTPERYLDASYRDNMSSFRITDQNVIDVELARLAQDLADGTWKQKYGHTLLWDEIDAGYCFLKVQPAT